ncbi:MAG TPA: metallophosphoesterase [Pyrinomonadaceae bacterium]|nr:metallophosphoesterase [Pyrinomonadaceae bacterium]
MKLVLFSDLHLDTVFAWTEDVGVARKFRDALRAALLKTLQLAKSTEAHAILCAGDLYEHDRFSPDTQAFLSRSFAEADLPVVIAPGNHDWYGPASIYRSARWAPNVHIFSTSRLEPLELADGLTLWGAAHCAPAGTEGFLRDFRVNRGGVNLALFHGSERSFLAQQGDKKMPHAPFDAQEIERAGLQHAFVGHYHCPRDGEWHTYPGNPEFLSFGETGERGPVVVTIHPDGTIERERHHVAAMKVHDIVVDVTGCSDRQDVLDRVEKQIAGLDGIARITLTGEMAAEVDLRLNDLKEIHSSLETSIVRLSNLRVAYDFLAIQKAPTVRGQFVRDVLAASLDEVEQQRILVTGLRALDGRDDLEVA